MTGIHLSPEDADANAAALVEPIEHMLPALQALELQMNISQALRRESTATSKRIIAYLAAAEKAPKEEIKQ